MNNIFFTTLIIFFTFILPRIILSITWATNGGLILQYISELIGIYILIDIYLLTNIKLMTKYICNNKR